MHNGKKNFLVIISARHHSEKCCSRQCGRSQLLVQNKKHIQKSTFLIIQKPTSKAHRNQVPFIHSRKVNLLIISHFFSWMMRLQKKCKREFQGEGVGQQFSTLLLKHSPLFSVALQFIKQFIQTESIVYLRKLQQKRCCIFFMI